MSLIADALKAAQEAKSGPSSTAARTASARRILAPAVGIRGARRGFDIPKQLQVALAVFGVALATAAAVVVAAPSAADGELPAQVELAANPLVSVDGAAARGDGASELDSAAGEEVAGASTDGTAAATPDPGATTGGDSRVDAADDGRRPGVASEAPARPRPSSANTPPAGSGTAGSEVTAGVAAAAEPPSADRAGRQEPGRGFEIRLGASRTSGQWFNDALSAQRRRDYGAAIQLYERALQENPENVEALNNLGTVYQASGDLASAREAFRRAITVQPGYASAWSNLGMVLGSLGEHGQSQAALTEAIRLDPGNHGARVNLALQYQKQGLPAEAKRLLGQVVQANPGMAEAHYALGRLLEEEADRDGAVRHYRLFLTTGAGRFPALEAAVRQRVQQLGG